MDKAFNLGGGGCLSKLADIVAIIVSALLFFFYCYLIKLVMRREDKHRVIDALELRIGIHDK